MIHHIYGYTLINIPKAHKHRRDVRKVTQSHLESHLPTHVSEICVRYLYLPTFPGMSCFETCGILRAPMIGCIASYFTLMCGFHNARCPLFPSQCITCNPTIDESCQCPRSQSPSYTDHPFMIHDRKAMAQFAIAHEPDKVTIAHIAVLGAIFNFVFSRFIPNAPIWFLGLTCITIGPILTTLTYAARVAIM
jgi:hypothetical protein